MRILCIDDDPDILVLLGDVLYKCGHETFTATSVSSGLRAVRRGRVDVVILDYEMPEMTGADAALQFRRASPGVSIVMFSGFHDDVSEQMEDAIDLWVEKPDLQALLEFLDNRRREREDRPPN